MTGRVSENFEVSRQAMLPDRDELHRGLGLLRVCIVLQVLIWVAWIGVVSMFLRGSPNTGPMSLVMGVSCLISILAILALVLLSIAMRRCMRSSGLSPKTLSVLLVRIVLLIWMFWALFHFFQNGAGFVVDIQSILIAFQQQYGHYITPPYSGHILRLLFVLCSIALARKVNTRCGNRLVGVREFRFVAACGMLVWLANVNVMMILYQKMAGGMNFLVMYWLYEIGSLMLKGFGVFWIWRALGLAQIRLNAQIFCLTCGYDLTGNISGTCPECGRTISDAVPSGSKPLTVSPAGAS